MAGSIHKRVKLMRSLKTIAVALVALPLLLAAGSASAALKIAVIRSGAVVQNSPQYLAAEKSIKAEFGKRKDKIEAKAKKLSEDMQNFQKNADVMTPDQRVKKQNELLTRRNDLKYEESKFKQDLQKRDQQATQNMMSRIKAVITQIAKQDGYDLVLQDPVYTVPSIDITDQVLKQLKKESK